MDIHLGPFEGNTLPNLTRLVGKVLKVEGNLATIEFGGQRFDVELTIPLLEGDRVMALPSKEGNGLVLKVSTPAQPVPEALTDFDLPAILKDWGLKAAEPAARALVEASGQLEEKALRRFLTKVAGLPPEQLPAAAKLFTHQLPITRETLEWAAPKNLGELVTRLKQVPEESQAALSGILERLHFTPEKGLRAIAQALEAPEALLDHGVDASDNPTSQLGKLAGDSGVVGQWAQDLLGVLRNAQLLGNEVKLPFWFEGGEGHLEAEGGRVMMRLDLAELGVVRVTLMQVDGLLSCLVAPEQPDVADWLSEHVGVLEEGLSQQGYRASVRIRRAQVTNLPEHVDLRL